VEFGPAISAGLFMMVLSSSRLGSSPAKAAAATGAGVGGGGGVVEVVVAEAAGVDASVDGDSDAPPHAARRAAEVRASATSVRPPAGWYWLIESSL
jgi:hypothetical protein